jgi:hypothetical protein
MSVLLSAFKQNSADVAVSYSIAQAAYACKSSSVVAARAKGVSLMERCAAVSSAAQQSPSHCAIITGASFSYFARLKNLVGSILLHDPARIIVVYDLGLNEEQAAELASWGVVVESIEGVHVTKLHGESGEGWDRSSYSFKPQVLSHALAKYRCVLWLDSSFEIHSPLDCLLNYIEANGLLLSVNNWLFPSAYAHPASLQHFGVWHPANNVSLHQAVQEQIAASGLPLEVQSGIVGISSSHRHVLDLVVQPWVECARLSQCIAPDGSDKSNHRQDQTVLNAIIFSINSRIAELQSSAKSSAPPPSSPEAAAAASAATIEALSSAAAAAVPVAGDMFYMAEPARDSTCSVHCSARTGSCEGGCPLYRALRSVSSNPCPACC